MSLHKSDFIEPIAKDEENDTCISQRKSIPEWADVNVA